MSKSKHTPGPWVVKRGLVYNHICVEGGRGVGSPESDLGHTTGCVDKNETARANACLMAAAPDLLEAAKAMVASGYVMDADSPEWLPLQAAIAKAEDRI